MRLTEKVKEELITVAVTKTSAQFAEAATMIRVGGEIRESGAPCIAVDCPSEAVAMRFQSLMKENFIVSTTMTPMSPGTKAAKYVVTITDGLSEVIRRLGLFTRGGHPVVGLPSQVVTGDVVDAEAAWRGAILIAGNLTEPGRSSSLEVVCPCPEVALALVGCARRMNVVAKTKESRGVDRVVIRDGDGIGALLTRIGAPVARLEWDEERRRQALNTSTNRLANFDDANLRRSARAAVAAAARVERAMQILGDDVPDHLAEAGRMRVENRHASLEELGRLADPQMTKDAVAGRIRRLLSMADKRAAELGIPDTTSAVTEEIFK